jgi:predicted double-glycine peptidase
MFRQLLLYIGTALFVATLVYRAEYPVEHPPSHKIDGFELISQPDDITCGPTSTLMLLRRYKKNPKFEEVESLTRTKWFEYKGEPVGMTSPDYISVALRKCGVNSRLRRGNIDSLKHYISQDRPCIVLVRSSNTTWHYMVATGYSEKVMLFADPAIGNVRVLTLKDFLGSWNFLTDMDGNDVVGKCSLCGGTGKWMNMPLGPLSRCELCGGTGRKLDFLSSILRAADVYPWTMIVPNDPIGH